MIAAGTFFPDGTGATVRVREFARGLRRLGIDVRVLLVASMRPEDWPDTGAPSRGEWCGIPYEYMSGLAHGQRGWVPRRLSEIRAVLRTCIEIVRSGRESRTPAVIVIAESLRWLLPITAACRVAGIPLVHPRSEFPFVYDCYRDAGPLSRLWQRFYTASVFRLFDGVVVISTHLERYIRARVRRGAWVMRIPILVDADTFGCACEGERGLVGYAGSLIHAEELEALVEAVSIVRRGHPETRVRIVGGGSEHEMDFVRDLASRHGIDGAVELTGFARADEMPGLLCGCAALALPRAAGLFSTAGMPTKLGEYLAAGRPVVVTATGDIPLYVHDGIEAFVVAPGDADALAHALERALYDPTSQEVGRAGQRLARSEFDPVVHMRRLVGAITTGKVVGERETWGE